MLRRCRATMSRVGTGARAGTATRSSPSGCRPRRGTSAIPRPARTSARCESNSIDWWAIRGSRPVPSYIRVSHWRQIVPSGVATHPSSTRSRGVTALRPASGWSAVHDHVGDVRGDRRTSQVLRDRERYVAPAVHQADLALTRGHQVDGVPGLPLGQRDGQVGMCLEQVAHGRRDHPAHRGRERHHPQVARDRPGLQVQPGLDLLEVGEQPGAGVHEVSAVAGQHHAAADPLEQRHPRLALQSLHLLRDRARRVPEHVGSPDHRPVVGDGPERGQCGEIDHEANATSSVV